MYLLFTGMPEESCRRQLGSLLLYFRYIFQALINSLVHLLLLLLLCTMNITTGLIPVWLNCWVVDAVGTKLSQA